MKPVARKQEKLERRRPGEVRELFVNAARDVFAAKGYGGASTREIAERAQVSEALLFRHFGSKANLFNEAVLLPFNEFVTQFVDTWEAQREHPWTNDQLMGDFIEHLYDLLNEHRELALALIAASAHESDALASDGFGFNLGGMLDRLGYIGSDEAQIRHFKGVDIEVAVRAIVGMVLSMAVFGPWMLTDRKPALSRRRIIDEMVQIALHGVTERSGG